MVHALERVHPDAGRIAGYAVAITCNALLLMLLLVPASGPPGTPLADTPQPRILWYQVERPKPVVVPVVAPTPPTPPAAAVRHDRIEPVQPPAAVLVDAGAPVVPAVTESIAPASTDLAAVGHAPSQPLPGVRLEYLQAPPPVYPRAAMRLGIEGTVLLQVLVDVDGKPLQVDVRQGSGDRRLDAAAREQVLRHWRFRPAMQDGRAVQAIGLVPIEFKRG
jgi:protein TonB